MNLNVSPPEIIFGPSKGKADVTLTLEDEVFEQLALGKLIPAAAFMAGKLKAKGKIMLAQQLGNIFKSQAKL